MPWFKSGLGGLLAALLMFVILYVGIYVTGFAPIQISPSAAFLVKVFRLDTSLAEPLGVVVHFSYGIFWSIVLLAIFWDRTSIGKGVGIALILWLFMMFVISPIIGWGVFGVGVGSSSVEVLKLESTFRYILFTLVLHLIYGIAIGWMNSRWVRFGQEVASEIRDAREDKLDVS